MYRNRFTLALLTATTLGVACSQESPSSPLMGSWSGASSFAQVPILTQSDLVQRDTAQREADDTDADGSFEGLAFEDFDEDLRDLPMSQIFEADSRADFQPGFAAIYGTHKYTGNGASITTDVHVTYRDQHLGTVSGERQAYNPFLLDFGRIKHIWVFPKVYTDHECGLTVQGGSRHSAWWTFFQGNDVQTWGKVIQTTQARPRSQPSCSTNVGSFETEHKDAGGMVCTYWITYDMDTGQIISAELLYCSSTSGEVI